MNNSGYDDYDRAVVYYASCGEIEKIQHLINNHYDDCRFAFDEALRGAAANGHVDIVKLFMEQGCDIKAFDCAALKNAAVNQHFDMVMFLIRNGCSVSTAFGHNTSEIKNMKNEEVKKFLLRVIKMERIDL